MSQRIINDHEIQDYLTAISGGDCDLAQCLHVLAFDDLINNYGDCLVKAFIDTSPTTMPMNGTTMMRFRPTAVIQRDLNMLAHWMRTEIRENAEWTHPRDPSGIPTLLYDLDIKAAKRKMVRRPAFNACSTPRIRPESPILMTFPCGAQLVQIMNAEALSDEALEMSSCLANTKYLNRLQFENFRYYSLRNAAGRSLISFEVNSDDHLCALEGHKNKADNFAPFQPEYWPLVKRVIETMRWKTPLLFMPAACSNKMVNYFICTACPKGSAPRVTTASAPEKPSITAV